MRTNAIILITGSELTRGETKDLNGPFLGTELTTLGIRVDAIGLVPDDPAVLHAAVTRAMADADVVLLSGGLGPTADDHTVRVIAEVFDRKIYRHPEAEKRMQKLAVKRLQDPAKIPANYFKQAEVVEGADVLLNPIGLAPGMAINTPRGLVAVAPGVPRELKAMFRQLILPRIGERFGLLPPRIFRAKVVGVGESWAEARIQELGIDFERLEYGISAKPGELLVKLVAHRAEDHALIDAASAHLMHEFGADCIILPEGLTGAGGEALDVEHAKLIHDLLRDQKASLAIAESCTGGLIAKRLTDHPGSSDYLKGAVVAYANEVKERVLGVPGAVLARDGAVSGAACAAMAEGAGRVFASDLALATTGIAGPGGGTVEKPVGLVYTGLARRAGGRRFEVAVEEHRLWGDRSTVRALSVVRALEMLRRGLPTGMERAR